MVLRMNGNGKISVENKAKNSTLIDGKKNYLICEVCKKKFAAKRSDAKTCSRICRQQLSLNPTQYDGDEWYTPLEYIEAARKLYGEIDLDPASCVEAQAVIQAKHFFAKKDNGLKQLWFGNVWCNPPYSTRLVQLFTSHAVRQYEARYCTAVLLLVNNCTDTAWFRSLAVRFPMMLSNGRADFWRPNQENFATRQGQAIFYLGPDKNVFFEAFEHLAYAPNR